jgi:peptidyl-prolyl cis-trans isomerase-like protein 2
VFGRVVGGFEVLSAIERIDTDDDDRPTEEVKITGG